MNISIFYSRLNLLALIPPLLMPFDRELCCTLLSVLAWGARTMKSSLTTMKARNRNRFSSFRHHFHRSAGSEHIATLCARWRQTVCKGSENNLCNWMEPENRRWKSREKKFLTWLTFFFVSLFFPPSRVACVVLESTIIWRNLSNITFSFFSFYTASLSPRQPAESAKDTSPSCLLCANDSVEFVILFYYLNWYEI